MKLKNYTSTVSAEKTISEIEQALIDGGATSILKDYAPNGKVLALKFKIKVEWGDMFVVLPANVDNVYKELTKGRNWMSDQQKRGYHEQAERTAWRLMGDWVKVQLSLIRLKQVQTAQVFMAYSIIGDDENGKTTTMFDALRETKMKAIAGRVESA